MVNRLVLGITLSTFVVVNSSAQARISPDLKCGDMKAKATGLKAFSLLKTFMSNKKRPNSAKLTKNTLKAQSKFNKAFEKAESKGGCATSGDAATLEKDVDDFVAVVLARLCPSDTTTTTTPTSSSTTTTIMLPSGSLVINEIDYDQPNADDQEFVEIFNPSSDSVDLSDLALVLVNGSDSTEYRRIDLSVAGVLTAGQYLVVGSALVAVPPAVSKLELPAASAIQNGPDGVALINTVSQQVLDVLSYEGEITASNIVGFSNTVNLVEGSAFDGADTGSEPLSLVRNPNGMDSNNAISDWALTNTPTPGEANL